MEIPLVQWFDQRFLEKTELCELREKCLEEVCNVAQGIPSRVDSIGQLRWRSEM